MAIITAQAALPTTSAVAPNASQPRQPATNEPVVEPAATEPAADPMASKFAALARKEKAMRAESQKAKAERDAWLAEKAKYETDYIPKSSLKSATIEALKNGQLPYDEVVQEMMKDGVDPQVARLEAKIAELEAGQNKFKTDAEAKTNADYQAAVNQIRTDVKAMVDSGADFELIKELGQHEAVVALIEETFKEEGRVMSNDEAAQEVEAYLLEEALKVAQLNKIKQKLAPAIPEPIQQPPATKQPLKTLTNAVANSSKPMSARERAILAFKGQLT